MERLIDVRVRLELFYAALEAGPKATGARDQPLRAPELVVVWQLPYRLEKSMHVGKRDRINRV
jgi:hypothetical protein